MSGMRNPAPPTAGWAGGVAILLGGLALLIVLVEFSAGPFTPQPDIKTMIGETAAGIREAAIQALKGEAPPPAPVRDWDVDRMVALAGMTAAGLAVFSAAVGLVRREPRAALVGGATLGATAILLKVAIWVALLIAGVSLVWAILANLGQILDW